MVAINSNNGINQQNNNSGSGPDTGIGANYQMFMKLLVAQMQHQDPMNPSDPSQFTNQLVQYASVEQQIKMNSHLTNLEVLAASANATGLLSYVGKTVEVEGATASYDGKNEQKWKFTSSDAASDAVVTIKDSNGKTVYEGKMNLVKGENTFTWDGKTSSGGKAPAGDYTISIKGKSSDGSAVQIDTKISGKVTGVDFSGSIPKLTLADGRLVSPGFIKKVTS